MKKKFSCIICVLFCFMACACSKNDGKKNSEIYYGFKKVADYLYEVSYSDYVYDSQFKTITKVEDYGCSSVKNGNFYGRNFDFIFNDVPEFIVKIDKNKKRHASIGVALISTIHEGDNILKDHSDMLKLLPNMTMDGINDQGVIASINVVPKADTLPVTGTNPVKEDLNTSFIVRYILDNANSADHAIELLNSRNIYGDAGDKYNLHVMIADKDKTYVVEFIDNKLVAKEKTGNEQIMTNFYVNLDELTENSAGVERYNILKENYSEGSTMDGMWNLMKRVKYSQAYLINNDNVWYSEFVPQSILKNTDKGKIDKVVNDNMDIFYNYWISRTYEMRNPSNQSFWFTTHNSVYDIEKRKLRITIQENYDTYYEYTI